MRVEDVANKDRTVHYSYHLVACIDLLGQKQNLAKLLSVPHTSDAQEEIHSLLKKTYGHVRFVRNTFADLFNRFGTALRPDLLEPAQREQFARFRETRIPMFAFSDTIVVGLSLTEDPEFGHARAAKALFAALAGMMGVHFLTLAARVPLRAGIDIERAMTIGDDEVYGPALVCAHHLESGVAQYPRAVVGPGVAKYLRFLSSRRHQEGASPWDRVASQMADQCGDLLCYDPTDHHLMLDFLSPWMMEMSEFATPAGMALRFAQDERAQHVASRNHKLVERYSHLLEYFAGRGFEGAV